MRKQLPSTRTQPDLLACDIHDGPYQDLVSAKMFLDSYRHGFSPGAGGTWVDFDKGMRALNRTLEGLRRLMGGRRPVQFDGNNLLRAIQQWIAECSTGDGREIEFCDDLQDYDVNPLPPTLELAVFRIVQQCVTNACRHSKSHRVLVGLAREHDWVFVEVQDWGIGFDLAEARSKGFGLNGICWRVKSLGGTTTIQSEPGKGTCVTVALPVGDGSDVTQAEPDERSKSCGSG